MIFEKKRKDFCKFKICLPFDFFLQPALRCCLVMISNISAKLNHADSHLVITVI